jgi:hypothetical protein
MTTTVVPLDDDFSDVLTVCAVRILIRHEDLGGDEATAGLADHARKPGGTTGR